LPGGHSRRNGIELEPQACFGGKNTFFGNKQIDAFSTLDSLRGKATTCNRKSDTAAYWVPTLYRHGKPVRPTDAVAYYTVREQSPVRPYPPGLKVVAGSAEAASAQPLQVIRRYTLIR
jgi:Domain of unknown function (DUF1996)